MHIGIIGMGHVGRALGQRWATAGHAVTFGVRDPDNAQKRLAADSMQALIGPVAAAAQSDAILLAVPWHAVPEALQAAGDLRGKVLLDCTNPVNADFTDLSLQFGNSAGEAIAAWVPQARVVKIFNTNGSTNMANPDYGGQPVTMLYAGDDAEANRLAASLAAQIGFEPVELGPLRYSRLLESLAMTWIILARHRGFGRDFALNLDRRP